MVRIRGKAAAAVDDELAPGTRSDSAIAEVVAWGPKRLDEFVIGTDSALLPQVVGRLSMAPVSHRFGACGWDHYSVLNLHLRVSATGCGLPI